MRATNLQIPASHANCFIERCNTSLFNYLSETELNFLTGVKDFTIIFASLNQKIAIHNKSTIKEGIRNEKF